MTEADEGVRESLVASIARDLREQILEGQLAPGRRISQLSIAEHYGVSRLPVREALRELSSEGLVILESGKGARVAAMNGGDLREVYLLRERLEPLVIGLAVPLVTSADLSQAEEVLHRMEAIEPPDAEWLRLDRQFHMIWYERAQMPRMIRTIDQLWDVAQRYRSTYSMTPGMGGTSNLEHWQLLESIRRRSAKDAELLLEVHVRRTRLALEPTLAVSPDARRQGLEA